MAFEKYRAIVSSDWNECLAPCGPFDVIAHTYPEFGPGLDRVFRQYTGNRMSLGQAAGVIGEMLPGPITRREMDLYLDARFEIYPGVVDLIEWCARRQILFMINTTGTIGYFQRIFAKGLLPPVPVLSAHPMIRYPAAGTDPASILALHETSDKGTHTEATARRFDVPLERVIVMGDSGGDGPHFAWAARSGAFKIGSMIKASLDGFCREKGIRIDVRFGVSYGDGEKRDAARERAFDFMALSTVIERRLGL